MYEKTVLNEEQKALISKVDINMNVIQVQIDDANIELQKAMEAVNAIRDKIRPLRKELSPLAEMKAGIASAKSRDKYFPDYTKAEFIKLVESKV